MAELATIARPYAEGLYKAAGNDDVTPLVEQLDAVASVAADAQLRSFADNPKVTTQQVFDLITSVVKSGLSNHVSNLLRTVIENGRLAALHEVAKQFHTLANARAGVSEATVYSAFPIDASQLSEVVASLEKRFGRKLNATVQIDPELIGGIKAVVGDEVLDTSVKARLEHMKVALTA